MVSFLVLLCFFFFFQAEDGIRDGHVTGVQTCALPISGGSLRCVSRVIAHSCAYLAKVAWDISTANKNPARPSRNPRRNKYMRTKQNMLWVTAENNEPRWPRSASP